MFEPFENKYVWNLSVNLALSTGGLIGEVDVANRPLLERPADENEDEATEAFFWSWCGMADRLVEIAEEDEAKGRLHSAGEKHRRAAVYYQTAERMQNHSFEPRREAYRKTLASFARFMKLTDQPARHVEIPFENRSFPGILMLPDTDEPAPCVIFFNGLDSTKEQFYGSGTPDELRRRGIATLMVDAPGAGEALRLRGMTAIPESER